MVEDAFAIDVEGATIAGLEIGEGLPVVFLHASVCDKRMWLAQMEAVAAAGWHAIAYDRRGAGETVSDDVPFSHLDDLDAVLDALDLHAAVIVGCSMGGGLAVNFALQQPGRVLGLVLMGTSVRGAPWSSTEAERAIEMAEEDALERGDLELINKVQAHAWLDGPRSPSGRVGGAIRQQFLDMNAGVLGQPKLTQEERAPDAWSRVSEINAPTLLMVGDEDFTAVVEIHEQLSEEMPNAFAAVLEGVAHIPSIERPDLVNSLLVQFLDAIGGGEDSDDSNDESATD